MSTWKNFIKQYTHHLQLERAFSVHSVDAYLNDIRKLARYFSSAYSSPSEIDQSALQAFIHHTALNLSAQSQARLLSSIRSFYQFLHTESLCKQNPSEHLEFPQTSRYLPDVLSAEEIDQLLNSIDLSQSLAHRDRAVVETLYGSGLRVSELTQMHISHLHFDVSILQVIGKGNRERLVPMSSSSKKYLLMYLKHERPKLSVRTEDSHRVFLNARGRALSRVAVFLLIKHLATAANIRKNISPHTFRHCFATHLIEGGADLRAVQEMLGHSSITTTEIYTHLDLNFLRKTIHSYHPRG